MPKVYCTDWFLVCAIATTTLLACGGATESSGTDTADNKGGTTGVGGNTPVGKGGFTGLGGASMTTTLCCNSRTMCEPMDLELAFGSACPSGYSCYDRPAVCCSPPLTCARFVGGDGGASWGGSGGTGNVSAAAGSAGATLGGAAGTSARQ